jgi:hypothetical protein
MGKRELLLIGAFLLLGMGVYHVTAPPPKPGQEGLSIGRLLRHIRSEIQGENAEAHVIRNSRQEVDPEISRLVLIDHRGSLKLIGEDRADITAELTATAFGLDDSTAHQRATEIQLKFEPDGEEMKVRATRPSESRRSRMAVLTLRVPARLACSLEFRGEAEVNNVAEVKLLTARGKALIRDVPVVEGELTNGALEITHARVVDVKTERAEVRIEKVAETLTLEAVRGSVRLRHIGGKTTLKLERVDAEAEALVGEANIHAASGSLTMRGIAAPVEISGESVSLELTMAAAVPISASTSGEELQVELPPSGVTLDALAEDGRVRLPQGVVPAKEEAEDQGGEGGRHVKTDIHGGGPTLRLRNEHADIVIRNSSGPADAPSSKEEAIEKPKPKTLSHLAERP